MDSIEYQSKVREAFASTNAYRLVDDKPAVILERIARGGGATNWYYCRDESDLRRIIPRLLPGSVVTLYFDERLNVSQSREALVGEVARVIDQQRDCVVGILKTGEIEFGVDFVTSIEELEEFIQGVPCSTMFMFGAFPGRDNDGKAAITIALPDADGVFRAHPH